MRSVQIEGSLIENRNTLDALEMQGYDRANADHIAGQERLICRVDVETLEALSNGASSIHVDLDTYMRALTYSYAKMLRDKKAQQDKAAEERRSANMPLNITLPLPKHLQALLFDKDPLIEDQEHSMTEYPKLKQGYIKGRLFQLIEESTCSNN